MEETNSSIGFFPFTFLPPVLENIILEKLDFDSLLTARLVSNRWNDLISKDILPKQAMLNVRMDNSESCRSFRKGFWKSSIMGNWEQITVFYNTEIKPSKVKHYVPWSRKSSFRYFQNVKNLVMFEKGSGVGAFLDLVHNIMSSMDNVTFIHVRENQWNKTRDQTYLERSFYGVHTFKKSWNTGLKNLSRIETFKINIFDRPTTMIYLQLLLHAQTTLVTLDVDFSKNYGLPFEATVIEDTYNTISALVIQCKDTLQNLRIKWDHRTEDDKNILLYSTDMDPFSLFLDMLLKNLEEFQKLELKTLMLNFPTVPFFYTTVYTAFVPFLNSQEGSLERLFLSRVPWDASVTTFHTRFPVKFRSNFEYGVYMGDYGRWTWLNNQVSLLKTVRSVEFECLESQVVGMASFHARRVRSARTGNMKWAKHQIFSLKVYNSFENIDFHLVRLTGILNSYSSLQEFEIIDGDGEGAGWQCSNHDLNLIFRKLTMLKSLKLTKLKRITDAGLCNIPDLDVIRMKNTGVCFPQPDPRNIPIAQAKCLKYVELRDLTSSVTDISVYLAIQHIPNLEKISVNGKHNITSWGARVLQKRFSRNPLFSFYFQKSRKSIKPYMRDFP